MAEEASHDDNLRGRIFAVEMFRTLDTGLNPEIHEEQFRGARSLQTVVDRQCVKAHGSESTPVKGWWRAAPPK